MFLRTYSSCTRCVWVTFQGQREIGTHHNKLISCLLDKQNDYLFVVEKSLPNCQYLFDHRKTVTLRCLRNGTGQLQRELWSSHFDPSRMMINRDNVDSTCKSSYSCLNCNTLQVCRPTKTGYSLLKTIKCVGKSPYCDPNCGACVSQKVETCGLNDGFVCMGDDMFPDADCRK